MNLACEQKLNSTDLHVHSDASDDGEWPPERIVDEAYRLGMTMLAITDHNRTVSVARARVAAKRCGLALISGIEIDCCHAGINLHLLGYGIDPEAADFELLYQRLVALENAALAEKLRRLACHGLRVDAAALLEHAAGKAVTGEHIAEALLNDETWNNHPLLCPYRTGGTRSDNPYVNFYWDWFHQGRPCFVPVELPPLSEAIALVHRHGGVAVIAHPGASLRSRTDALGSVLDCGVDGIEVYNNYHSPEQCTLFREAARSRNLVITCGSDFHGKTKPAIGLGRFPCAEPAEQIIEGLLKRIAEA